MWFINRFWLTIFDPIDPIGKEISIIAADESKSSYDTNIVSRTITKSILDFSGDLTAQILIFKAEVYNKGSR